MTADPAQPSPPDSRCRPRLAIGVRMQTDRVTGQPVLLFPEGMLKLNPTGAAIVELCDGRRSAAEVVTALAERFNAPAQVLAADVTEYLARLAGRRLISWDAPAAADDPPRDLPERGGPHT